MYSSIKRSKQPFFLLKKSQDVDTILILLDMPKMFAVVKILSQSYFINVVTK